MLYTLRQYLAATTDEHFDLRARARAELDQLDRLEKEIRNLRAELRESAIECGFAEIELRQVKEHVVKAHERRVFKWL